MITFQQIGRVWNKTWFEKTSPAPLCLFRIIIGAVASSCALTDLFFSKIWFYDACPTSLKVMHSFNGADFRLSIFNLVAANETTVSVALMALALSGFTLSLGLKSRLSAFLVWLLRLSFYNQNIHVWNCGDAFLQISLLLMILGPSGNLYSLDALIRRKRRQQPLPAMVEPWVQRLIQFQIMVIYGCSFFYKTGATWWNGTAVHYALNSYSFSYMHMPVFDMLWASRVATWGTLAIEFSLFTLIWVKGLRKWVLLAGAMMHVAMFSLMTIHALEILMIASYLNFIDPAVLERFVSRFGRGGRKLSPQDADQFATAVLQEGASAS